MTDLVIRAKKGDGDAFAELFLSVQDELYRVAYLYVKNHEDAKDVVQETAYRCFKGIKHLREAEYFRTWAVRTAMNCAVSMLRKNRRELPLEEYADKGTPMSSPECTVMATIMLEELINGLNEREKSIILCRYHLGMSLSETAASLKLPLSTVKTTLYRAIAKINKESSYET